MKVEFDLRARGRVVIAVIDRCRKLGCNSAYMQGQGWNLVRKMVDADEQDLARYLDLELEYVSRD